MTIAAVTLYRYALPLTEPLALGDASLAEREGLLLRVRLEGGAVGWGDVAPLPGFSAETVEEAVAHARRLRTAWTGQRLPGDSLEAVLQALPGLQEAPPSVQFGGESALVEAVADERGTSPAQLLGADRDEVVLNALVRTGTPAALAERGRRLREAGYRAVKLKVGRDAPPAEAERVWALRRALGPEIELRLDANRAWSLPDAIRFWEAIDGADVAYVEEPVSDGASLPAFVDATGCPVALDETTRDRSIDVLAACPVRAVVLKPTLLGLRATQDWAIAARRQGAWPVLSASYESGVGTRMLLALAAALSEAPAGLLPYTRLATDVLVPRLSLEGPTIARSSLSRSAVAVEPLGDPLD
jgi:O-succinylbenzoate synthase